MKFVEVNPESSSKCYRSDAGEGRALVRLYGLGEQKIRAVGRLSDSPLAKVHGLSSDRSFGPSSVSIRHTLRGDSPLAEHSVRIFRWSDEIPNSSALYLPGIDVLKMEMESDGHFNRTNPQRFTPMSIVRAMSFDGMGGTLQFGNKLPRACPWYYLENEFICAPDAITLESVGVRQPNHNQIPLESTLFGIQRKNVADWFNGLYTPERRAAPSRRPITENYYYQFKRAQMESTVKDQQARAFFGSIVYDCLELKKQQIMSAVEARLQRLKKLRCS